MLDPAASRPIYHLMNTTKDLAKQAPATPRLRTGGYAILARALDKGRAEIAGTNGDY